jgi:hypothetical protein
MPPSRMWTRIILMAGTVIFALMPFYLTAWKDAIYDGALLIIAVAFSSDAAFRCLDPANKKSNLTTAFAVRSMAVLALSLLQYGPIANDLRKEKVAIGETLTDVSIALPPGGSVAPPQGRPIVTADTLPIVTFEKEREKDEKELPNSSLGLLIASIIVEF